MAMDQAARKIVIAETKGSAALRPGNAMPANSRTIPAPNLLRLVFPDRNPCAAIDAGPEGRMGWSSVKMAIQRMATDARATVKSNIVAMEMSSPVFLGWAVSIIRLPWGGRNVIPEVRVKGVRVMEMSASVSVLWESVRRLPVFVRD